MILSMTGFGRGTAVLNGREITVELRSVNSRYFEYSSRIPRSCSYMDSRLKKQLNERVTRGKVELSMTIQNVEAADAEVTVNMELARSYQKALRNLSEKLCIKNDVTVSTLTRFPDVLATRHADVDEEQLWADVSAVTAQEFTMTTSASASSAAGSCPRSRSSVSMAWVSYWLTLQPRVYIIYFMKSSPEESIIWKFILIMRQQRAFAPKPQILRTRS